MDGLVDALGMCVDARAAGRDGGNRVRADVYAEGVL